MGHSPADVGVAHWTPLPAVHPPASSGMHAPPDHGQQSCPAPQPGLHPGTPPHPPAQPLQVPESTTMHDVPLQPGAAALPQSHAPFWQTAGPLGS